MKRQSHTVWMDRETTCVIIRARRIKVARGNFSFTFDRATGQILLINGLTRELASQASHFGFAPRWERLPEVERERDRVIAHLATLPSVA